MPNPYRGEALLDINGKPYTLRLSLGALASLEASFGHSDLGALIDHLFNPGLRASQMREVLLQALVAGGDVAAPNAPALLEKVGQPLELRKVYLKLMKSSFVPRSQ